MKRTGVILTIGIVLFFNWFVLTVVIKDHLDPEFLRYAVGFYTGAVFVELINKTNKPQSV